MNAGRRARQKANAAHKRHTHPQATPEYPGRCVVCKPLSGGPGTWRKSARSLPGLVWGKGTRPGKKEA